MSERSRSGTMGSSTSRSVYGGAGGRGIRISTGRRTPFDYFSSNLGVGYHFNEKVTMQNLNDRLASYLEQVRSLETANAALELKIKDWLSQRVVVSGDYTRYQATIEDLYLKVRIAYKTQTQINLDIENARLAADDFKTKYENELVMRQAVMADNVTLKNTMDQLTVDRSNLEMEVERSRDDIIRMKRSHQENMALQRAKATCDVNVEVDAAHQDDLAKILEDMRSQYEQSIQRAKRELEVWYQKRLTELDLPKGGVDTELDGLLITLSDTKRTAQRLEIELQSIISQRSALEVTLQDTLSRYNIQLGQFQVIIGLLETEVAEINSDITRQRSEYNTLLDIKERLQMEIAEYRRLLDGEQTCVVLQPEPEVQVTKRTRVIEEVIVDGKVVSREEDVEVEKLPSILQA